MNYTDEKSIVGEIKEYKEIAINSPLGKFGSPIIDQITLEHDTLLSKLEVPLRLAIIGEVKAGKSTLLNAIAKGEVSPTNVSEATASIIIVQYGETNRAKIHFVDGTAQEGQVSDIFSILREHLNDQAYFSKCSHVEVNSSLEGLRNITIIDTPGLGTITEENEERTLAYFQDVDVVLWMFNGNYLGQSNINEKVRLIYDMGKTIIAVINRVDEVDGDPEDLKEFLEMSMGEYFTEVFPLSAKKAFEARIAGNEEKLTESGYVDLYRYIRENVDSNAEKVQLDSIRKSNISLHQKLILEHKKMKDILLEKSKLFSNIADTIENARHRQINEATSHIMQWINDEFLAKEKVDLLSRAEGIGAFSGSNIENSIINSLNDLMKSPKIKQKIDAYVQLLSETIISSWKNKLKDLDTQLMERFELKVRDISSPAGVTTDIVMMEGKEETFGDSMTTAVVAGGAIATYVAVAGPAAAHVGIGAAMGGIMPPLLLAGAAVGLAKMVKANKGKKDRVIMYIESGIEGLRNDLFKTIQQEANRLCDSLCDKTLNEVKATFATKNLDGKSSHEVAALIQDIDVFLSEYKG